jgi:hypothetical protein
MNIEQGIKNVQLAMFIGKKFAAQSTCLFFVH